MKIRTDFVTNSSSSSFVIEIDIKLKSGKTYNFQSACLSPEAGYPTCTMAVSPKQLAKSKDIKELCKMLKHSAYLDEEDDFFGGESKTPKLHTPVGASKFIKSLEEIDDITEISEISISGEEFFGKNDESTFRRYTYNLESGSYTQLCIGNEENLESLIESGEGRGGDIAFSDDAEATVTHCDTVPDSLIRETILAAYPDAELSPFSEGVVELPSDAQQPTFIILMKGEPLASILATSDVKSKSVKLLKSACKNAKFPLIIINATAHSNVSKAVKDIKKHLSTEATLDLSVLNQIDASSPTVSAPQEGEGWSVKVKFADKRAYNYNCFATAKVGDIVFVDGARSGMPGIITDILENKTYPGYYNVKSIIQG